MPATRKLYNALAECIYNNLYHSNDIQSQHDYFLERVCDVLEEDNPRFDREKFLKATKGSRYQRKAE